MVSPVILILGAGANTGAHLAQTFAKNGYKVALASRSASDSSEHLSIKADFSEPTSVESVFDQVKKAIGTPNVVIYNAAAAHFNADPTALSVEEFSKSLAINTASVYAAGREAVAGFAALPSDATRTFIYTGNILNTDTRPPLLDLGVGKSASAYLLQAWSMAYKDKGYQFYYGDERFADGSSVGGKISGENHAKFYWELVQRKEQGPWDATFVGGKGYVDFKA